MTGVKKIVKGFTVLEMVVVMGIFSIASVYSMSAYVKSNTGQRKIVNISKGTTDARYAMETMVREIRTGKIDYQKYIDSGISITDEPIHDLIIRDADNNLVWFSLFDDGSRKEIRVCYTDDACNGGLWSQITPANTDVTTFDLYIWPKMDPFTWDDDYNDYKSNEQPKVTIIIRNKSLESSDNLSKEIHLQTTVTSRAYVR